MICIEILLEDHQFDGVTAVPFSQLAWESIENNYFRGTRPAAARGNVGILDFFEILEGLTGQFGPFLDTKSGKIGQVTGFTGIFIERVVGYGGVGDPGGWIMGTHTPNGWGGGAGVRLRECPEFGPTETAETFQAGGSGQVSNSAFANGQAGGVFFPSGMRTFIEGGIVGENLAAFYVQPLIDPRSVGDLALAGQPAPQFI